MISGPSDRAMELLTATYFVHLQSSGPEGFRRGTALDMAAAAERIGMITGTPSYESTVEELEAELAIEENPITARAIQGTQYIVGPRGRDLLGLTD